MIHLTVFTKRSAVPAVILAADFDKGGDGIAGPHFQKRRKPPVKEPPNQPRKPPVKEPEDPPDPRPLPDKPPIKKPPDKPPKPPVKEPPRTPRRET